MRASQDDWWLVLIILLAVALFGTVTAVLVSFDPRTSGAEAIRTGGLVSAAVVALYALWLNDRRRRVEESRHELERSSHEQDRARVADERVARAVELLGHEADQVRADVPGWRDTDPAVITSYTEAFAGYWACGSRQHALPGLGRVLTRETAGSAGVPRRVEAGTESPCRAPGSCTIATRTPPRGAGRTGTGPIDQWDGPAAAGTARRQP
ncbi:MAG: hypothetical protein ACRDR6_02690 [Pseudonocardiaceae bacterium]